MLARACTALVAVAALLAAALLPVAVAAQPAAAVGSGSSYPSGTATCGPTNANPCRAAIEWRTSAYGPSGDTQILRRTFFSVYAVAGEQILLGSSSMQSLSGSSADIVAWNPGILSKTDLDTVANASLPTPNYKCSTQRGASTTMGTISTRAQELAGPKSIDGTVNTSGYTPCYYTAPSTGIYRVAFYGTAGNNSDAQVAPDGVIAPTGNFANPAASTAVLAWDITVRPAATTSGPATNLAGRVFTYALVLFTGGNPRPIASGFYLNTTDGFRYKVDAKGMDPNAFVIYGNQSGFLDADGTPLNHDVVATATGQTLGTLQGGTHLSTPQYPLSYEPLSSATLGALGIPTTPTDPVLNSVTYAGKQTSHGSYVSKGGTFTIDTGTSGTYEIVMSRDGSNFDPGLPTNATLRGVVSAAGIYAVTWDGKDNEGNAFPVQNNYAVHAALRGGEYHAPMLDVESSYYGGPSITLQNPPNGTCPFTGVTSTGSNCTQAFYDDRGYQASSGTDVGTPGGLLCNYATAALAFAGTVPSSLYSDPVGGFDSSGTQRAFGTQANTNSNAYCPGASGNGTLGDAKGLDVWTFFPSATQTTTADVLPLPASPTAADDSAATQAGVAVSKTAATGVLTNDTGTTIAVTGNTAPSSGTLALNSDGSYTYTPATGFSGVVTSTYTITDDAGQTATAVLTITVTPKALDDSATTSAGVAVSRTAATGVLSNDVGSTLQITGHTAPSSGTLTLNNTTGAYTYTPAVGFTGTVTSTYTVKDSANQTTTAVLTIVVSPPPTATNDSGLTSLNTPLTVAAGSGVLANDTGASIAVTGHTAPASGTLTLNADGSYSYTPAAGVSGTVTSTYTITDSLGQTATAVLTISVTPTAANDTASTTVNTSLLIGAGSGVLVNDHGTGLTVVPGSWTLVGLTLNSDGSFTYAPPTDFTGTASTSYTATDTSGLTVTATLTITVTPTATNDSGSTAANTQLTVDATNGVLKNDHGTGLHVTSSTAPASGTLALNADGSYTYTPASGFSGSVSSTYTVKDGSNQATTAVLTITVTPTATNDSGTTAANTPLTVAPDAGVLVNDLGTGLHVSAYSQPSSGSITIASDGSYTFTPAPGFSGAVTVPYTATDGSGQTASATLSITVTPSPVPPTAVNDSGTTPVSTSLVVPSANGVLANDSGAGVAVTSHTAPSHGSITLNGDGSYTYTPTGGYSGPDSVDYTITAGNGLTASATLSLTVTPTAADDANTTVSGVPLTVLASSGVLVNDSGSNLYVASYSQPSSGTISIPSAGGYTFTPAPGFVGAVTVPYVARDSSGQTANATLTITVTPAPIPPTAIDDSTTIPAAAVLTVDAAGGVLANDSGDGIVVTGHVAPTHGSITLNGDGSYVYTPDAGFSGTDSVPYTITAGNGLTATATLTITVTPIATDDSASTTAGVAVLRAAGVGVLTNDTGASLSVVPGSWSLTGLTLNSDGSYSYTPAAGFSGVASTDYTAQDGIGQTATATLTITVTPTASDDSGSTTAGTELEVNAASGVLGNDAGTGLTVTAHDPASHGALSLASDGSYTYTPNAGFSGTETIGYTATDGSSQAVTATLTITVTPAATVDDDVTVVNTAFSVDAAHGILANDHGTGLAVTGFTAPSSGDLTVNADGSYSYTPASGFSGTVTSTCTVEDSTGQSVTELLTIVVTPLATDDSVTTTTGVAAIRGALAGILPNDLGSNLTVTTASTPSHGTLNVNPDGSYVYTPNSGFSGYDSAVYTAEDGEGQQVTATLHITVVPLAENDGYSTAADTPLVVDAADGVLKNDTGTVLTITGNTDPASGTLDLNADGSFTYTPSGAHSTSAGVSAASASLVPAANLSPTQVTSTYTAIDNAGQPVTAVLTITITAGQPTDDGGSGLASTGTDRLVLLGTGGAAIALILVGIVLIVLRRKRRA